MAAKKKTAKPTISKADFVRQHPDVESAIDLSKLARDAGLTITPKHISSIRGADRKKTRKRKAKKAAPTLPALDVRASDGPDSKAQFALIKKHGLVWVEGHVTRARRALDQA